MIRQVTWSALILAALAAVAFWGTEDKPECCETRPVFGASACCERHRVAGKTAITTVADLEAARRAIPSDLESGRGERISGDHVRLVPKMVGSVRRSIR
jgi:hypothetical protein